MTQTQALEDVLAAYLEAERVGRAPAPQVLFAKYPSFTTELQSFLADREHFRQNARTIPPVAFARVDPAKFSAPDLPRSVGNYEIVGELGRGGMGVVYKALQVQLKRLVALKMVLHAGHAGPQELARFRTEAEAVARLQHPNIVHVHEVGEHEGRPFFSLEYVDGGSLSQRINGQPQPTRQGAALVETLAQAMEYAHQQGIVHRDLKPANVLLTAQGMPKITDFGLAKRLEQDSGQTRTGAILGTPSYIAPEQAAGKKDVGPAADIYALGAILYEMLTGRPPFRGESPMDTMLQVMTSEVVPPSRLQPKVPRDLETICLKCLEKDPNKRYARASLLANDLRRFLNGESITARPAGSLERGWRWCRRRPLVAALLLAVFFTGLSGVAGVTYMWRRAVAQRDEVARQKQEADRQRDEANRMRREAEKQRQRAEENLNQTRKTVDEFFTMVSESQLLKVPGLQPLRKQLLDAALRYYQNFLKQRGNDPALKRGLANAYFKAGRITYEIGSKPDALANFRDGRKLYQELLEITPDDRDLRFEAASSVVAVARLEKETGQIEAALRSYREAEVAFDQLHRARPGDIRARHSLAFVYADLGVLFADQNKPADALKYYDQARGLFEGLPASPSQRLAVVLCYRNLARQHVVLKQSQKGLPLAEKAIALAEQLAREYPADFEMQRSLAVTYAARGNLAQQMDNFREMLTYFDKARIITERLVQQNPSMGRFQRDLGEYLLNAGHAHHQLRQPGEAVRFLTRARDIQTKLARDNPAVLDYQLILGETLLALGQVQKAVGRPAEALQTYEQAQKLWEQIVRARPGDPSFRTKRDLAADQVKQLASQRRT